MVLVGLCRSGLCRPGGCGHVVRPKALRVEGHLALCADVDTLGILLPREGTHLAVPGGFLPVLVLLRLRNPVVSSVVPKNYAFNTCIYVYICMYMYIYLYI